MNKIVLVCEGLLNRAGIERMTIDLANLLSKEYEVCIIVINSFRYETCPFRISANIKVRSLNTEFKKGLRNFNISIIKGLRSLFKKEQPKAVITVATPLVRLTAPACFGLPVKNIAWEHFNIYAGSRLGTLFKIIAPWFVDNTVVLTQKDEQDYKINHAPRVLTIPNFTTIGNNSSSMCDKKTVLAVGRHAPQKGFDMLIKAWAKTNAPGWILRIVGSGADKGKNEKLAEELKITERIEFKDATSDIVKEYQEASCFVLSSRFEGLVLVLIEAKMMGLPSICFDCPNSPREVIRNGIDGILVENGNINELASKLTQYLSNHELLREMGQEARLDAISRYSPEAVRNLWINLLEK